MRALSRVTPMEILQGQPASSAYALIVGIGRYQDPAIRPLEYTHADAEAFFRLLTDPRRCGIPEENIKLLLDEHATLFNIKHAISGWLYQHAAPESSVIVFFAGHGGVESDRTGSEPDGLAKYLLPWDTRLNNLFASGLSNSEFHLLLKTIKAQRLVIFMDACYSGGVAEKGGRDLGIVGNPYKHLAEGQGRLVIAASKPNQRSWEDETIGHGIFTHHLIEALSGKADADGDGYVSIMEVYKYLERNVPLTARRLARGTQEPLLCGNIARDIILTVDTERIAATKLRRQQEARARDEQMQRKRQALFALYDGGDLPADAYHESVALLEQLRDDLSDSDRKMAEYLDALIEGGISPRLYLDTREVLQRRNQPAVSVSASRGEQQSPPLPSRHGDPPPSSKQKFCTRCGTELHSGNRFCVGCGRRITD